MATVQIEPLIYNKFRGIREQNGVNSGGAISAIHCENVELYQSDIGDEVGIKSTSGNTLYIAAPTDYNIVGIYKSEQKVTENSESFTTYFLIYAEHKTENIGKLYYINDTGETLTLTELTSATFTKTGKCNGLTMTSTAYDVFIFTNGIDAYSVCFATGYPQGQVAPINFTYNWKHDSTTVYTMTASPAVNDYVYDANGAKTDYQITAVTSTSITVGGNVYNKVTENNSDKIRKKDHENHEIKFIAMTVFNGFLVVATNYGVRASRQNNIYTWNDNPTGAADSWYINYSKPVTALYAYTGGLFIFTGDTTDFITGSPNVTSNKLMNTAGVGCMNYQSIVKHDTYLFFYDNNQKNIYYIENIDNGQTRPAGPIAKEIQSYFKNVETFKMYSCIYNTRNEIWCLIDKKIMVYDYFQNEWLERKHENQLINSLVMIKNSIFVSTNGAIYQENNGDTFAGEIINSVYETCFINVGSNTNLKKQKTPLLLVLNDTFTNDFYIQLTVNGKAKSPKHIKLASTAKGFFYKEPDDGTTAPESMYFYEYDDETHRTGKGAKFAANNPYSKTVKEVSTPQTWYSLGIKIYTRELNQGFCINSMELKNIKAKLKTKGR